MNSKDFLEVANFALNILCILELVLIPLSLAAVLTVLEFGSLIYILIFLIIAPVGLFLVAVGCYQIAWRQSSAMPYARLRWDFWKFLIAGSFFLSIQVVCAAVHLSRHQNGKNVIANEVDSTYTVMHLWAFVAALYFHSPTSQFRHALRDDTYVLQPVTYLTENWSHLE